MPVVKIVGATGLGMSYASIQMAERINARLGVSAPAHALSSALDKFRGRNEIVIIDERGDPDHCVECRRCIDGKDVKFGVWCGKSGRDALCLECYCLIASGKRPHKEVNHVQ